MLSRWQRTIVDAQGNVVPYAQLQIKVEITQATATIYADRAGNELIPNGIVTADVNGYAYFYAPGGLYRIQSVALGIDWRHVPLGNLQGMDEADLGLGGAATRDVGTGENTVAAGNDSRIVNAVQTSGNQTVEGIKTFSSFPVTPSGAPTDDYQAANKKYVDDNSFGMGQTWQDVAGSRVADTTYTNTTGRTIVVKILVRTIGAGSTTSTFVVNGSEFSLGTATEAGETIVHEAILPNGGTYMLSAVGNTTIFRWMELR